MPQEPQIISNRTYCCDGCKELGFCVFGNANCKVNDEEHVKQSEIEQKERDERLKEFEKEIKRLRIVPLQNCIFAVMTNNKSGLEKGCTSNYCFPYQANLCVFYPFYEQYNIDEPMYYEVDLSFPIEHLRNYGYAECNYDEVVSIETDDKEQLPKMYLKTIRIKATGEVFHTIE